MNLKIIFFLCYQNMLIESGKFTLWASSFNNSAGQFNVRGHCALFALFANALSCPSNCCYAVSQSPLMFAELTNNE
uniref:Uncharacterized protein n=1 Tax=Rhizophora mucronata TaxID=61149 RepID=A0A2P2N2S8_RHIMU